VSACTEGAQSTPSITSAAASHDAPWRRAGEGVLFETNEPDGTFLDYGLSFGYCLTFK
jgi:hypothetical protein